ncbi:MAG: T9SS type A sorting domain-containing protein [Polaribacter sp.]|uniref:T9SS type A sorting domain-containing protein n=1 Tax=Polaribacter sp. TaxID=1920175 RepID=UPI003EF7D036
MKKKYTFKTIKTGFAIFAMALSFANANAQTTVSKTGNIRLYSGTYDAGTVDIVSNEIAQDGVTFKLQATLTPNSTAGSAFLAATNKHRYGVDGTTIDGDKGESIEISNLTVIDFDPGTTPYTVDAISDIHYTGVTLNAANGVGDQPLFTVVGGSNTGDFNIGQTSSAFATINFGTEFFNQAAVTAGEVAGSGITVGNTTGVTSFTLANGSALATDSYQIVGTNWSLTFTQDNTLGVNDVVQKDSFSIYPTIVENTFTVNKAFKTLQLFNLTGKAVKTFNSSDALEVSGLAKGLYIVKLKSETGAIATSKLIVK